MHYRTHKPHLEQLAEAERRKEQTRLFRRNQALGVVLLILCLILLTIYRAPAGWLFPPGWWRL